MSSCSCADRQARASVVSLFVCSKSTPTTAIYTLSLHDALPISIETSEYALTLTAVRYPPRLVSSSGFFTSGPLAREWMRSEEHTSELQSHSDLVCRLLLEKKKRSNAATIHPHLSCSCSVVAVQC